MKIIERILVGGVWIALFLELLIAFAVWTRTEIADYDIKVVHGALSDEDYIYCPYCGERLEQE